MKLYDHICRFGKLTFSKNDKKFCDPEGCDATEIIKYLFENTRHKRFFNTKYVTEDDKKSKYP